MRGVLLALLLLGAPAMGQERIVAGLSQNHVSITADFTGSEILIYGAVKRDAPAPAGPMDVIITVEGPSTALAIRRKDRVAGIWINNATVKVDQAPSFYAIATTGPLDKILSSTEDLRHRITIPRAIRAVGASTDDEASEPFVDALIRIRTEGDVYRLAQDQVELAEQTLFRTDVLLPSNLTEGVYRVRMFLMREGAVVDWKEADIDVRKAGLERFLFRLSKDAPLVYGILSLLLALVAGWGASELFRRVRF